MGSLIDTSILIEVEKRRLDIGPYISRDGGEEFFLSVVTVSELLHGVHRAQPATIRNRRAAIVEGMLEQFTILDIDLMIARSHARLWADMETSGNIIGPHDLWLAATCLAHGFKMVTANVREFSRVPGIQVERWGNPA